MNVRRVGNVLQRYAQIASELGRPVRIVWIDNREERTRYQREWPAQVARAELVAPVRRSVRTAPADAECKIDRRLVLNARAGDKVAVARRADRRIHHVGQLPKGLHVSKANVRVPVVPTDRDERSVQSASQCARSFIDVIPGLHGKNQGMQRRPGIPGSHERDGQFGEIGLVVSRGTCVAHIKLGTDCCRELLAYAFKSVSAHTILLLMKDAVLPVLGANGIGNRSAPEIKQLATQRRVVLARLGHASKRTFRFGKKLLESRSLRSAVTEHVDRPGRVRTGQCRVKRLRRGVLAGATGARTQFYGFPPRLRVIGCEFQLVTSTQVPDKPHRDAAGLVLRFVELRGHDPGFILENRSIFNEHVLTERVVGVACGNNEPFLDTPVVFLVRLVDRPVHVREHSQCVGNILLHAQAERSVRGIDSILWGQFVERSRSLAMAESMKIGDGGAFPEWLAGNW